MNETIGIIGLGLIGGSIAKALKKYDPTIKIIAYDKNKESIKHALKDGIINSTAASIESGFVDCTIIILCIPVKYIKQILKAIIKNMNNDTIITDVCSTKNEIIEFIETNYPDISYIGGHPMAGSEKDGYNASFPSLFENAYYVLTPTNRINENQLMRMKAIVDKLNAIPMVLNANNHDFITAGISHIPHIIAAALVNLIEKTDTKDAYMHKLAAGGFRDLTRIASSSPDVWESICLSNKENIIELIDKYISELNLYKNAVLNKDGNNINYLFATARTYRDSFSTLQEGSLLRSHIITVNVIDRPGAFAEIAGLLSKNNINIKNIGIAHNRELEEGVMEVSFYDRESCEIAVTILKAHKLEAKIRQ